MVLFRIRLPLDGCHVVVENDIYIFGGYSDTYEPLPQLIKISPTPQTQFSEWVSFVSYWGQTEIKKNKILAPMLNWYPLSIKFYLQPTFQVKILQPERIPRTTAEINFWQQRSRVHAKMFCLRKYLIILGGVSLIETELKPIERSIPDKNVLIYDLEQKTWDAKECGK